MAEKIQIKIKQGKDPEVNIKHINALLHKIRKQGIKVIAKGGSIELKENKNDKYIELYSVFKIELEDKKDS